LRSVFLGTSDFAAAVLQRIAASEHRPRLVLTRPDRPRGRGRRLAAPPVARVARELGIALEQPQRINDPAVCALIDAAVGDEASAAPDGGNAGIGDRAAVSGGDAVAGSGAVLVVCAFGALIREPLLSAYELLNVHPSLLPRWRGAAPVERAIMAGDARTGVSIMRLTEGLDSGPVCAAAQEAIGSEDTYGSLAERLRRLGGELLVGVLDEWERGRPPRFEEQPGEGVTYAEKIGAEDRLLDPARTAVELERQVRALHPHIGARLKLADGTLLGVSRAAVADAALGTPTPAEEGVGSPSPGRLATGIGSPTRLLYGASDGTLELLEVQPPGGRPMDAEAYLRGHALS
jgi:methionyl-tRNA formyltransferase